MKFLFSVALLLSLPVFGQTPIPGVPGCYLVQVCAWQPDETGQLHYVCYPVPVCR